MYASFPPDPAKLLANSTKSGFEKRKHSSNSESGQVGEEWKANKIWFVSDWGIPRQGYVRGVAPHGGSRKEDGKKNTNLLPWCWEMAAPYEHGIKLPFPSPKNKEQACNYTMQGDMICGKNVAKRNREIFYKTGVDISTELERLKGALGYRQT
jgi:hypothetical protein